MEWISKCGHDRLRVELDKNLFHKNHQAMPTVLKDIFRWGLFRGRKIRYDHAFLEQRIETLTKFCRIRNCWGSGDPQRRRSWKSKQDTCPQIALSTGLWAWEARAPGEKPILWSWKLNNCGPHGLYCLSLITRIITVVSNHCTASNFWRSSDLPPEPKTMKERGGGGSL